MDLATKEKFLSYLLDEKSVCKESASAYVRHIRQRRSKKEIRQVQYSIRLKPLIYKGFPESNLFLFSWLTMFDILLYSLV